MDTTKLVAARDALNADIGKLLAITTVDQATIDILTTEVTAADTDVVKALGPPPTLDFTKFDAAVVAFKADAKLTQAAIDVATGAVVAATI